VTAHKLFVMKCEYFKIATASLRRQFLVTGKMEDKHFFADAEAVYDGATDGPEIDLIRAFRAFPEGAHFQPYWRSVRDSSS
jgi:hypothetical protein